MATGGLEPYWRRIDKPLFGDELHLWQLVFYLQPFMQRIDQLLNR